MNSGETELTSHKYPQGYLSDGLRVPYYGMAASPEKVVYSFLADHNLYAASSAGDPLEAFPAKSQFFPQTFPTLSRTADRNEVLRYIFTEPRYRTLLYDPAEKFFTDFVFQT
jgi:hypothetical protein